MVEWTPYRATAGVVGTLLESSEIPSPQLGNSRRVLVHLPDSAASGVRRYRVLYAHDGDNLFDPAASYAGEWRCDETMASLAREGIEAIVVAIPNAGDARIDEYGPWPSERSTGRGGDYLGFVADTIKPIIDATFPTLPARANTGVFGSSMGGVISLYAYVTRPDVFGLAGIFSPAFLYAPGTVVPWLEASVVPAGRIWLDVGTAEFPDAPAESLTYVEDARTVRDILLRKGTGDGLRYVEDEGAVHDEAAWARRLPDALRFLLGDRQA